jgi:hypothetical protein
MEREYGGTLDLRRLELDKEVSVGLYFMRCLVVR